jgi:DNA invertase Pin-like site-specific DNA recombinase
MGLLTLNVLLSFAQFEREVTGERIRDKVAASKKKGMWMGGHVPKDTTGSRENSSLTPRRQWRSEISSSHILSLDVFGNSLNV